MDTKLALYWIRRFAKVDDLPPEYTLQAIAYLLKQAGIVRRVEDTHGR